MSYYLNVYKRDHVKRAMCFIITQFEAELMDANDILAGGNENLRAIVDSTVKADSISPETLATGTQYLNEIDASDDRSLQACFMRLLFDIVLDMVSDIVSGDLR